jgi:methyl-accepting chemotaxis protein
MSWIRRLSIAQKIYTLVALGLVAIAAVGGAGLWSTSRLGSTTIDVGRTQLPAVRNMTLCDMMHDGMLACVYRAMLVGQDGDREQIASAVAETADFAANFRRYSDALDDLELKPETRQAIENVKPDIKEYVEGCTALVGLCAKGQVKEAREQLPAVQQVYDRLETSLGELGERIETDADTAVAQSEQIASTSTWIAWSVLALGAALSLFLGMRIARLIVDPLNSAVKVLESGDMAALSCVDCNDEIGRMAKAVTETVGRMEASATEMAAQKRTIEQSVKEMERTAHEAHATAEKAEALAAEAARVAAMVENAPTAMMYADSDMQLVYFNPESEAALGKLGADFAPARLKGQPLSRFFRDPRANLGFLTDESNLPVCTQVQFGDETIDLCLCAIHDNNAKRVGTLVNWRIITEQLKAEATAKELQKRELEQAQQLQDKVERMLATVDAISRGDLTAKVDVTGTDAIGRMGQGLARLLEDLRGSMLRIRTSAEQLSKASDSLTTTSVKMNTEAQQAANQVQVVATSASKVAESMTTVSDSTAGMTSAISEIARSSSAAAKVARTAVETADSTNATVGDLDRSSEEIGAILKTITTIAQQTNLLALNATIEAARAGEAGRGFAVVANEVKELAKATAKATTDISGKITAMQSGSRGAVEAITRIGGIIREIDSLQTTIAAAVEQQTAATHEITQNVQGASASTTDITANMSQVASAAREASTGASETLKVSSEVSRMADELMAAVGQFRL